MDMEDESNSEAVTGKKPGCPITLICAVNRVYKLQTLLGNSVLIAYCRGIGWLNSAECWMFVSRNMTPC